MFKNDLQSFSDLIEELRFLPGISFKNVQKIAYYLAMKDSNQINELCRKISVANSLIKLCQKCFGLTERDICETCDNSDKHSPEIVCVVSTWIEYLSLRYALSDFSGQFHILGGVLSPIDGIGVDQLRIRELVERLLLGETKEVIFAFSPTPESEVTISCIQALFNELNKENLKILFYKIASGVPIGAVLENADRSTIMQAIAEKRLI